jgi:hypothetical protein
MNFVWRDEYLLTDLITVSRVSDALGVDWTDLVEESKRRAPNGSLDASYSIRRRWKAINILARIGVSEKYAGEELYSQVEKDIAASAAEDKEKGTFIWRREPYSSRFNAN